MNQEIELNSHEIIRKLEEEISFLEQEIQLDKSKIIEIENLVRFHLQDQLVLIQELEQIYKEEKRAKKEKRLEQKRKGKNYKEITGINPITKKNEDVSDEVDEDELKRLYKGAIVKVHPDKFNLEEEKLERAHEVSSQLISFYQEKNLEGLKNLYDHIMSGNAMSYQVSQENSIVNSLQMIQFLENKKSSIKTELEKLKSSPLLSALNSYKTPLTFVTELRNQFDERIEILKKRTRKSRKTKNL